MKMYETPVGIFSETQIDPNFKAQGLANGTVVEREATHAEELADCQRRRADAYALELPDGEQHDAAWHARRGNLAPQQALDARREAIKARIPKPPAPVS